MSCVAQYNIIYKGPCVLLKMTQLQYECKKIQNYTKFALNVYNPVQLIILQDVITLGILGKQKKSHSSSL